MRATVYFLCIALLLSSCADDSGKTPSAKAPDGKDSAPGPKPALNTGNAYSPVDLSPMDMSYYPVDYPKLRMAKKTTTPPLARIIYSRPHLQGRHIFHEVLKYEEPWRLGANEATELDLFTDVTIQNKKIKAGRYIIYCIPHISEWTIVLNSNIDSWGLEPDPSKDIAKFRVPVLNNNNSLEYFTMVFEKKDEIVDLIMAWDNTEVRLPILFEK
jgi:hypothetical protein